MRDTFAALRPAFAPPVAFLEGVDGGLVSHPDDLSKAMHAKWGPIFEGNGQCEQVAASFIAKYGKHVPLAPSGPERPITAQQLSSALRRAGKSASGADGWLPSELAFAPRPAVECLVCLLNHAEATGQWPAQLR
eukprot:2930983-Alexandrium_andersonii.AAC.1